MLLKRVAAEKALPIEPLVPNAETVEAIKAARRGDLVTAGEPRFLLASLNADCYMPTAASANFKGRNQGGTAGNPTRSCASHDTRKLKEIGHGWSHKPRFDRPIDLDRSLASGGMV
jgi:DNA-damage-inducible protein J